jgi:glycosyltransferase involved in cell wall biosynthesis
MSAPPPATILFFDHTAAWGGGEVALFHLVTNLDRARFTPIVVLGEDGPLADRLREAGVFVHVQALAASVGQTRKGTLGLRGWFRVRAIFSALSYCWKLRGLIRRLSPALVFTNSLKADLLGGIAARLAGVKVIWSVQDRIANDYLPKAMVRFFRAAARLIPHAVVANSRATLETLRLPPRWQGTRAHVVHCGVVFPPQPVGRTPANVLSVGIIGRLAPWKGQEVFLRSVRRLVAEFPAVRFQIVGAALFGETEFAAGLRRLAVDLGVEQNVEFLGFRHDIPEVLRGLDVVVHASTSPEPFGLVIAEAMAAGKAVIASRGGGVPEIVVDGVTGLLVPMGDEAALARAIAYLLRDESLRTHLAAEARKYAGTALTVQRQAAQTMEVLASLCPPPRQPAVPVPALRAITTATEA